MGLQLIPIIEQLIVQGITVAKQLRAEHGMPPKSVQEYHDEAAAILAKIQETAAKEQQ